MYLVHTGCACSVIPGILVARILIRILVRDILHFELCDCTSTAAQIDIIFNITLNYTLQAVRKGDRVEINMEICRNGSLSKPQQ